ncbi:RagB/SusD family nutrient uptake outer membrane protein [Phocaeicola coprocola]|uniref:RagB/SusD family nutrient uptake outer membrane protein n=1 Tax=Phocaeicola coprocola TaxID=310298 RepID=UPI0019560C96|nr:RagB/SusD family nutrient uptake outer membrane protein [Phocaeicola coprocola]MBM6903534.1 RagB/SusD family nutrient uptake outer membrane protein [Phocaeicola coprocola]
MKKYKSIILLFGCLCMASCSDFLDTESLSEQTGEVIYENEGMTRSAIMGIYSQLCDTYVYGQKMSVNWQGVSDIELASGYQNDPSTAGADNGIANYWCNWYLENTKWEGIFKMAELASTTVDGLRKSTKLSESKTLQGYLGEALVLRSLAYFELVRRYGDVPYKEGMSNSDLSNVYMGKTDRDSIYSCIIKDMKEAINYLPWMGTSDYNSERVTKGFAKGLLARIALFAGGWSVRDGNAFDDTNVEHYPNIEGNPGMEETNGFYVGRPKNWRDYYEIAEQQCAELIADPENPHVLDPDYGDIWKTVCGLGYNAYNENLFEVANGVGYSGDIGTLMGRAMDGNIGYGQRGFGGTYVSTNAYYFYSFDRADKRRDYACYWPTYKKDSDVDGGNREIMNNDIMNVRLGKWSFWWTSDTYRSIAATATSRTPTGINWIIMRYSDVLLMFAEAGYALNGSADMINSVAGISPRQALEAVRQRAFGADSPQVSSYDSDFFEAIVNERAWEFGGEGIRKLDLVRWGLLDSKIEDMKKAMLYMMDGTKTVQIFDKTYNPSDFPQVLYYTYEGSNLNGEFIDWSSVNFYMNRNANPNPKIYREIRWFPGNYWERKDESAAKTLIQNSAKVCACASGLRASYDYTGLLQELQWGAQIQDYILKNISQMGNGKCNYRHLYPIYYEDVYKSNGYLSNSYGY